MIISNKFKNSTFLVDTCFYIDVFSRPKDFSAFISGCKLNNIAFVSISLVKFEFIRTKSIEVKRKKELYFEKFTNNILPVRDDVEDLVPGLIEDYKQLIEGVSIVDLFLAATILKYRNLLLLTRNHSDFPTNIFTREAMFPIESIRDIKTYALYSYKPHKKILEEEISF